MFVFKKDVTLDEKGAKNRKKGEKLDEKGEDISPLSELFRLLLLVPLDIF